jgi:hypothetical protein
MANTRKSLVRKSVTRKYNTAKFETMDITVDHSVEVEWENIDQLRTKSDGLTTLVIQDYDQTSKRVFEEFRLNNISATVNQADTPRRGLSAEEKKDFDSLG